MTRQGSFERHHNLIHTLKAILPAHTVILFGSSVDGNMRPDSDIDIAFISDQTFTPYEVFMKAQQLADQLGREVDLIDFKQASTVFKAQIVGTGVLIIDERPIERQYAFMRALKEYALLNEERQVILEKLGYSERSGV